MLNRLISHYFAEMYYLAEILFGNNTIQTDEQKVSRLGQKRKK